MRFLIGLGAQRCGTTFFYNLLKQHPEINASFKKEIHYFDIMYHKDDSWYLKQFPSFNRKINFEISPYYIFHNHSPNRIYDFSDFHDIKFIVFLRDPVQRAISQWRHETTNKHEKLDFEQAIKIEESRLSKEKEIFLSGGFSYSHNHFSYKTKGKYFNQLILWLDLFGREKFLILKSEDLYKDPEKILSQTEKFLQIKNHEYNLSKSNRNKTKNNVKIDYQTQESLYSYFEEYNNQLYNLIDRDMNWSIYTSGRDFPS